MYVHHVAAPIHDTSRPRQRVLRPLDIAPLSLSFTFFSRIHKSNTFEWKHFEVMRIADQWKGTKYPAIRPRLRDNEAAHRTWNMNERKTKAEREKETVQLAGKRNGRAADQHERRQKGTQQMWYVACYIGRRNRYTHSNWLLQIYYFRSATKVTACCRIWARVELIHVSVVGCARCHYSTSCEAKCFVSPVMFYTAHHPNNHRIAGKVSL